MEIFFYLIGNVYICTWSFLFTVSAESYLNECLSSCTTVYGPSHKKTLEVQDELARLQIRTQRENVSFLCFLLLFVFYIQGGGHIDFGVDPISVDFRVGETFSCLHKSCKPVVRFLTNFYLIIILSTYF